MYLGVSVLIYGFYHHFTFILVTRFLFGALRQLFGSTRLSMIADLTHEKNYLRNFSWMFIATPLGVFALSLFGPLLSEYGFQVL